MITAGDFFSSLFSYVDGLFSIPFTVFGFEITLWGLFLSGAIVLFLFRVLLSYIYNY